MTTCGKGAFILFLFAPTLVMILKLLITSFYTVLLPAKFEIGSPLCSTVVLIFPPSIMFLLRLPFHSSLFGNGGIL